MEQFKVVKFELENSEEIGVVAYYEETKELRPYSSGDQALIEKANKSFGSAISVIKGIGKSFVQTIKSMETVPDEVQIEFGMVLTAKLDALIAGTSAEANFKISMTWKNK